MSVRYNIIQSGGTSTDVLLSVDGMSLVLEMSYYKSGQHNFSRSGEMLTEEIPLQSDASVDTFVNVYLEGDGTTEGQFVVDACRSGIDKPYAPTNLAMHLTSFIIPKGFEGILSDLEIRSVRVV